MAEDDVVFRLAGDVNNLVVSLDRVIQQFEGMFTRMDQFAARTEPAIKKTETALDGLFGKLVGGSAIGTFFGNKLTDAFDAVVNAVTKAITAIPNLIQSVANTGDRFLTLSQQTGISVKALSQFDFVASQTGTSLEGLTSSIFIMQRNLANGGEGVSTALRKMKIDIVALKSLKPEDAFVQLMEGLGQLPTQAEKASAGMALFGRNFRSMAQLTTEDIRKLMKEADQLGLTMTDAAAKMGDRFKDAQDRLGRIFEGITRSLGVALLPAATRLIEGFGEIFKDFFDEVGLDTDKFGESAEDLVDRILNLFRKFVSDMVPFAKAIGQAFEVALKVLPPLIEAIGATIRGLTPLVQVTLDVIGKVATMSPTVLATAAAFLVFADHVDKAKVALAAFRGTMILLGPGLEFFSAALAPVINLLKAQFVSVALAATINLNALRAAITAMLPALAALIPTLSTIAAILSTVSVVVLAVAAAFAVWKIGEWIFEVTGLGDAIEKLWLRLKGLTSAQADAQIAAKKAAAAAAEEREELNKQEAAAVKRMKDLAGAATLLASQGKLTEFQLKRIGREAQSLKDQGIALDPVLEAIVEALDRIASGATAATEAVQQLTDAEKLLKFQRLQNDQLDVKLNESQKTAITSGLARHRQLGDIIKDLKESGLATDEHVVAINKFAEAYGKANKASEALRNQTEDLAIQMRSAKEAGLEWNEIVRILGPTALSTAAAAAQLKGGMDRLSASQKQLIADAQKLKLSDTFQGLDVEAFRRNQEVIGRSVAEAMDVLQKAHIQSFETLEELARASFLKLSQERMDWRDRELSIIEETRAKEIKALGPLPDLYRAQYDKIVDARLSALAAETSLSEIARERELKALADSLKQIGLVGPSYEKEYGRLATIVNEKYDAINAASGARVEKEIKDLGPLPEVYSKTYGSAAQSVEENAARMKAALEGGTLDPEALAKQLGILTITSLQQQLSQAETFLAQMRLSNQFTADDIIAQEWRVFEARKRIYGLTDQAHVKALQERIKDTEQHIRTLAELGKDANAPELERLKQLLALLRSQLGEFASGGGKILDALADSFQKMGASADGAFGVIAAGIGQTLQRLEQARQLSLLTGKAFGSLGAMFDKSLSKTDRFAAGIAAAGQVAQGISDVMAATAEHATAAGNAVSGALAGAKAGAAFGPWGLAIGAAAGLVVGLVRGKPAWAKAADEVGRDFGVKISTELAKAIQETAKKEFRGDRFSAELLHLSDIIKEAGGVTAANFSTMAGKLRDVFVLYATGVFNATQATKVLDENFGALLEAGTDTYGRISDHLREIIRLNQQFGTESKAIADFLKGQGTSLIEAVVGTVEAGTPFAQLNKDLDEALKKRDAILKDKQPHQITDDDRSALAALDTQIATIQERLARTAGEATQELADLGTQAVAAFAAATAAGVPWQEALTQISPALKTLREQYEAMGLSIEDAGLKALVTQQAMAEANPTLLKGVSALSSQIVALENLGVTTPETLAAIERTAARMFDQLKAEAVAVGGSSADALLPMQQFLHEAARAAERLGVPLDATTQGMIEASQAAGIWQAQQMSLNDIMIAGFSAIIEALGGEIPAAWQKMADAAKAANTETATAAEEAAAAAAASFGDAAAATAEAWRTYVVGDDGILGEVQTEFPKVFDEAAYSAEQAMRALAEHLAEQVGGSVDEIYERLRDRTQWRIFADSAIIAARTAGAAMNGIDGVLGDLDDALADTGWDEWANEAVNAARDAQAAIEKVAWGSSPGGVRQIRTELDLARQATDLFSRQMVSQMALAKSATESVSARAPQISASVGRYDITQTSGALDRAGAGAPSVYIAAGAFPISTWSVGSETEMIKKQLTPAVLTAIHGGGNNYQYFESMVRRVRK